MLKPEPKMPCQPARSRRAGGVQPTHMRRRRPLTSSSAGSARSKGTQHMLWGQSRSEGWYSPCTERQSSTRGAASTECRLDRPREAQNRVCPPEHITLQLAISPTKQIGHTLYCMR